MTVSNSTAEKLKSAGFPQPEPGRGQFWWYKDDCMGDEYEVLVLDVGFAGVHFDSNYGSDTLSVEEFSGLTYMPTATDILRELPDKVLFWRVGDVFVCGVQMESEEGYDVIKFEAAYKHENPAEACALAWLEKNTK